MNPLNTTKHSGGAHHTWLYTPRTPTFAVAFLWVRRKAWEFGLSANPRPFSVGGSWAPCGEAWNWLLAFWASGPCRAMMGLLHWMSQNFFFVLLSSDQPKVPRRFFKSFASDLFRSAISDFNVPYFRRAKRKANLIRASEGRPRLRGRTTSSKRPFVHEKSRGDVWPNGILTLYLSQCRVRTAVDMATEWPRPNLVAGTDVGASKRRSLRVLFLDPILWGRPNKDLYPPPLRLAPQHRVTGPHSESACGERTRQFVSAQTLRPFGLGSFVPFDNICRQQRDQRRGARPDRTGTRPRSGGG